jgi:hypothetical protein
LNNFKVIRFYSSLSASLIIFSSLALCYANSAQAQTASDDNLYSRKNTIGFFASYSNDSSHILTGNIENRKLLNFGAVYNRRLFQNHFLSFEYSGEVRPVALESDPLATVTEYVTQPNPVVFQLGEHVPINCTQKPENYSRTYNGVTYAGYVISKCNQRQWTIGEGIAPLGFQLNFLPRHKRQFFLDAHAGYMYSTHGIPLPGASSVNYTFDAGAGVELFRNHRDSIRAEIRYQHLSDPLNSQPFYVNVAAEQFSPSMDNVFVQLTYTTCCKDRVTHSESSSLHDTDSFSRKNTFGLFTAYSNDSSHIFLGSAENRKLAEFGFVYNRRLWLDRIVNWQYSAEFLPVIYESDPLAVTTGYQTQPIVSTSVSPTFTPGSCAVVTQPYNYTDPTSGITYAGTNVTKCVDRLWTRGEGISPIGFQWNFMPSMKTQFFADGHGGYMYSSQPIPDFTAGAFNFTFDIGSGIEYFRNHSNSLRAELRYHHISNHYTANFNPGIDNVLFQLTYAFGK